MSTGAGSSIPPTPVGSRSGANSWRGLLAFLSDAMWTALGACVALAVTFFVLMPALGVGNVDRWVVLARHIESGPPPAVVAIGNSITVEGIDAGIVGQEIGGGITVENWGLNGCALEEARVLIPKFLTARPRYVILTLQPHDIASPSEVRAETAYAYGMGGFAEAWPDGDPRAIFPGITEKTIGPMTSSAIEQAIFFRSTLLDWINERVRRMVRPGIRWVKPDEWVRPYELTGGISGAALERQARISVAGLREKIAHTGTGGLEVIRAAVKTIVDAGAHAVVCIAPEHPVMREPLAPEMARLRECLADLGAHRGATVLDASELFGAEGFADALHPNAEGREAYSRAVGEVIAGVEHRGEGD